MKNYETFAVCTSNALDFTCDYFKAPLSQEQKNELLEMYRVLPAFEDVKEGLVRSQEAGFGLYAFSNGSADAIEMLLNQRGWWHLQAPLLRSANGRCGFPILFAGNGEAVWHRTPGHNLILR